MYGIEIPKERLPEGDLRSVSPMLARIRELDDRPLNEPRSPEKRLVGCCRDFAVLTCAMLRHQGVPARVRFGFSLYFRPLFGCDHVVCEYWKADEQRWALVDPQMDDLHHRMNRLTFDTNDMPHDRFVLAGKAWQMTRAGEADPASFGYDDQNRGFWVIQSYLVHDLAALNKREMLVGDIWGLCARGAEDSEVPADAALLDRVATLALAGDESFPELRTIYDGEARLRIASSVRLYSLTGEWREITLGVETA